MPSEPTLQDLQTLCALHRGAVEVMDGVRWAGGGPVYPAAINAFMSALVRGPWRIGDYDPGRTGETLANLADASLDDIRRLFLHCVRSERFTSGAWAGILKGDVPLEAVFERIEFLLAAQA